MLQSEITLVVPCFNEAKRWNVEYWTKLINETEIGWIFVNDGSTDGTLNYLNKFSGHTRVSILDLKKNSGKAEAIRMGMLASIKKSPSGAVGFIDSDAGIQSMAVNSCLITFLNLEHTIFESLWGSRVKLSGRNIERDRKRHYLGRAISTYLSFALPLPYDTQCGFKIFLKSTKLEESLRKNFQTRWFFDLELFARLQTGINWKNIIWEEPLLDWREIPDSRINLREKFRIMKEIIIIRRILIKAWR